MRPWPTAGAAKTKVFARDYFLGLWITPTQKNNGAGIGDEIKALSVHGTCSKASAMSFSNLSQSAADIFFRHGRCGGELWGG
jgi:hypothetical protein